MNTNDLKNFMMVYQERSINQAAKKLYITPQGLSKSMKHLENEVETILFERTKQGVIPTASADYLAGKAQDLMDQITEMEACFRQLTVQKQVLRIGSACGILNVVPYQLIMDFMEKHQDIEVHWAEYYNQEVKDKIASSELEYGFIVGENEDSKMTERKIASLPILILVYEGHPYYERESLSIEMLRGEKMLVMNEHFHMNEEFRKLCIEHNFMPNIIAKTSDGTSLSKLCRQKASLAVVPVFTVEALNLDGMRAIPFTDEMKWDVYTTYKKENEKFESIKAFDNFVKEWGKSHALSMFNRR
ncbi:transcriptional regulator, LysR family [Lachnospiraceae bacterium KM106-2]|nr:transcriptional regulator, LysR family [Lachnospiraceae bacterium KM106-2]